MKLTHVGVYGLGEYSGMEYSEERWIKTESYNKIKDILAEEISVGELDGKHSQSYGTVDTYDYDEDSILELDFSEENDGNILKDNLWCLYRQKDLDFHAEQKEIKEYLDGIDSYVSVEFSVKKSQVEDLEKFVENMSDEDLQVRKSIEVFMGDKCKAEKLTEPMFDLMTDVWEECGRNLNGCLRVNVIVDFIAENK